MKKLLFFSLIGAVALCSSCVTAIHHTPKKAAAAAEEFAETAFVDQEFKEAYNATAQRFQDYFSYDQFAEIITKMHPDGYPDYVWAEEYEPIPGQQSMNIFLEGKNNTEKFYYRFEMEGTTKNGYKVIGAYRGSGPYPESELRQPIN